MSIHPIGTPGLVLEHQGSIHVRQSLKVWNGSEFVEVGTIEDLATILQESKDYTDAAINSVVSGYQGTLLIADPDPTDDGIYFFGESGTYANFGNLVIDLTEGLVYGTKTGTTYTDTVLPIDLNGYVNKTTDITNVSGKNIFRASQVQGDKAIASSGAIATSVGAKIVVINLASFGIVPGDTFSLSGVGVSSSKNMAFANGSGTVVEISPGVVRTTLFAIPKTQIVPPNAVELRVTIKLAAESDSTWANIQIEKGDPTTYESPQDYVSTITTMPLVAKKIAAGSDCPTPATSGNVANKGYVDSASVLNSQLVLELSPNLAKPWNVVADKYVNNIGAITNGTGWHYMRFAVVGSTQYTIGNFTITSGGYGAFYTAAGVLTGSVFTVNNTVLPVTVTSPSDAAYCLVDVGRPGDANYSQTIINEGASLIPYTDPADSVIGIGYNKIAGSADLSFFDLSDVPPALGNDGKALKVSDDGTAIAVFDQIEQGGEADFTRVSATAMAFDLPSWDGTGSPPAGLLVGDGFVMPDGTLKRRMV